MSPMELDSRLVDAVELFNTGEFFACHDVLEEIWTDTLAEDRTFYQGLIHAAVALHHFEEGNPGGARKMSLSARRYLAPFLPSHAGLDVEGFLQEFERCFADLMAATPATIQSIALDPDRLPRLRWRPPSSTTG
ncbi:MAG: DUF309 domain-containing protein [Planctomycetaceae bacterium]|nr:DUF309 domain-containing protein [Planctomycetaceae bacterium]